VTLMAVHVADSTGNDLKLEWTTIGVPPKSFTVLLDGKSFLDNTKELSCSIPKSNMTPGVHKVSVEANGAGTRYELSKFQYDDVSGKLIPVVVEKTFRVK
jgi:hypothetical protein